MTELEMAKSAGKNIRIILKNKKTINGFCRGFTQAIDNEPEIASVTIENTKGQLHGYLQSEIESIEVLE